MGISIHCNSDIKFAHTQWELGIEQNFATLVTWLSVAITQLGLVSKLTDLMNFLPPGI